MSRVTKWQLFNSMVNRIAIRLYDSHGSLVAVGNVNSVSCEDGSGSSFLVHVASYEKEFYVRTLD